MKFLLNGGGDRFGAIRAIVEQRGWEGGCGEGAVFVERMEGADGEVAV